MKPVQSNMPKHVGIILDGNRRFAKRLMMKPWKGHEWGYEKVKKVFDWIKELDIRKLTLYVVSVENFNRPKEEFDYLMKLFIKAYNEILKDKRLYDNKIRINFIGRLHLFPKEVQESMTKLQEATKNNDKYLVNIAMGYGGRQEVIDATKKLFEQIQQGKLNIDQINEESFAKCLYTREEPDLIIRTGGARRTSNFLIWQSNYSEWCFVDKFWPEFEKEDFIKCINDYSARERRFGK
tara:strand:- start:284 stop:994 length:711 start_codon:yes stop_codon:yes gene_type:complete